MSQLDFSGAGRTSLLGLRTDVALRRWVLIDGGLSFVRPIGDDGRRKLNALAELQAQVQLSKPFASPYLGLGAGLVTSFAPEYLGSGSGVETSSGGGRTTATTISSALGVRFHPRNQRIVLRTELRVRGIDGFNESAVEWTLGIGRRF